MSKGVSVQGVSVWGVYALGVGVQGYMSRGGGGYPRTVFKPRSPHLYNHC